MRATEDLPEQLILQRIRNRIIEYFEMASAYDRQRQVGISEVLNAWDDWVTGEWLPKFTAPVFSRAEQIAIESFHEQLNEAAAALPIPIPGFDTVMEIPEWEALRVQAESALALFRVRGKLSDHSVLVVQ